MSIRQDWMKLTRNVTGLVSAFQIAVGPAWETRRKRRVKPRTVGLVMLSSGIADLRVLAELELKRNRATMHHARNQMR